MKADSVTTVNDLAMFMADTISTLSDDISNQFKTMGTHIERLNIGQAQLSTRFKGMEHDLFLLKQEQHQMNIRLNGIDERLVSMEGEMQSLHSDIEEIYNRIVKLEQKLDCAHTEDYPTVRREVAALKVWARDISKKTGMPSPKF